jgi:hypothetical protein
MGASCNLALRRMPPAYRRTLIALSLFRFTAPWAALAICWFWPDSSVWIVFVCFGLMVLSLVASRAVWTRFRRSITAGSAELTAS